MKNKCTSAEFIERSLEAHGAQLTNREVGRAAWMKWVSSSLWAARQKGGDPSNPEQLRVAYLTNQYPKVSHSFIRREILAIERQGVKVDRIAIRGWDADVVDPIDIEEQKRTRYLLADGLFPLVAAAFRMMIRQPRKFAAALSVAFFMARHAERSLPYHLIYLTQACRLSFWLKQTGATHLHAHFGTNPAEVAMLLRVMGGPPYSFTVHGADEADKGQFLGLDKKVARAKFVVATSSYNRSQLFRRAAPSDWGKIKIVHCGLDSAFYDGAVSAPPIEPYLICVGRLSEEKGQLILLEAINRVRAVRNDCRLVLAGDGEMRPDVEDRIRNLGLQDHVRITGWISSAQVREEILKARALVLPSFQEGLPVVIMEAMALKRSVIATNVAGIPELVRSGESGWLVPAGSVEDLANAIEDCLSTPADDLLRMAHIAHQRVMERHTVEREVEKLIQYFRDNEMSREIEEWRC